LAERRSYAHRSHHQEIEIRSRDASAFLSVFGGM
jgi:hypothetical protein